MSVQIIVFIPLLNVYTQISKIVINTVTKKIMKFDEFKMFYEHIHKEKFDYYKINAIIELQKL